MGKALLHKLGNLVLPPGEGQREGESLALFDQEYLLLSLPLQILLVQEELVPVEKV